MTKQQLPGLTAIKLKEQLPPFWTIDVNVNREKALGTRVVSLDIMPWDKMAEAGSEPERAYTDQQLHSDEVTKKDILKFLQENAGFKVLAFA